MAVNNKTNEQGMDLEMFSCRLPAKQRVALKRMAARKQTTVQVLVREAIADLLRGRRAPRGGDYVEAR